MTAIGAWLAGQWGKALPYLISAAVIVVTIALLIGKLVGLGRDKEKAARAQADQIVRNRVDAVKPPASGETEKRLDEGRF